MIPPQFRIAALYGIREYLANIREYLANIKARDASFLI